MEAMSVEQRQTLGEIFPNLRKVLSILDSIDGATGELKKHRGWIQILANIASAIKQMLGQNDLVIVHAPLNLSQNYKSVGLGFFLI